MPMKRSEKKALKNLGLDKNASSYDIEAAYTKYLNQRNRKKGKRLSQEQQKRLVEKNNPAEDAHPTSASKKPVQPKTKKKLKTEPQPLRSEKPLANVCGVHSSSETMPDAKIVDGSIPSAPPENESNYLLINAIQHHPEQVSIILSNLDVSTEQTQIETLETQKGNIASLTNPVFNTRFEDLDATLVLGETSVLREAFGQYLTVLMQAQELINTKQRKIHTKAALLQQQTNEGFNALMLAAIQSNDALPQILRAIQSLNIEIQRDIFGQCTTDGDNILSLTAIKHIDNLPAILNTLNTLSNEQITELFKQKKQPLSDKKTTMVMPSR